jgi:hypothetical protein
MNAVGLWLVKSQTIGTGVSSIVITDAFTADYVNYRIVMSDIDTSTVQNMVFRFYASGAPITTANYGAAGYYQTNASIIGIYGTTGTSWEVMPMDTTSNHCAFDILAPNLAERTRVLGCGGMRDGLHLTFNGIHTLSTAYTSFQLTGTTGGSTFTGGTIRVYGYRN